MTTRASRLAYGAICLALVGLLAFGVLGVGRRNALGADHRYYLTSAKAWLAGESPYRFEVFERIGNELGLGPLRSYAYPPNSFGIGVLLQHGAALEMMIALALAALGLIVVWCMREMQQLGCSPAQRLWAAALVLGNPISAHAIWTGNVSVIIVCALLWAWTLRESERWLAAGLCLAVALMKPQLCVVPVVWVVLERRWKVLATAGAGALLMAATPLVRTGFDEACFGWFRAMAQYAGESISTYGFPYVIGVRSLLTAAGVPCPNLLPVALVLTVVLFWRKDSLSSAGLFGLLLGVSALFVYAHDYDLVMLAPLFIARFVLSQTPRERLWVLLALAALCLPMRGLSALGLPRVLLHWRTVVIIAVVASVLWSYWSVARRRAVAE